MPEYRARVSDITIHRTGCAAKAAGQLQNKPFRGALNWPDRAELNVLVAEIDALFGPP